MEESFVEKNVRTYLKKRGWKLTNLPKSVGQHGEDITAWHPKWRKILKIEAKGDGRSNKIQMKHSGFYTVLGQILSRMDIQGNSPNRARIYALAIPSHWEKTFTNKIAKMKYGWRLLRLKVFLVNEDGSVDEKPFSHWL